MLVTDAGQSPLNIRTASLADRDQIAKNIIDSAIEASSVTLTPQTVTDAVANLINRPSLGFYLVADQGDKIIGSLLICYEWSDWQNGVYWWINSVFVVPEKRRQGVYKAMYKHICEMADNSPEARGIKLSTLGSNTRAVSVYSKLGMKKSNQVIFYVE